MTDRDLLIKIYEAFNRRDIDTVLVNMHADVDWPNGMEGGRVHGREAVRQYWLRQWSQIDPRVEPQDFRTDPSGATIVTAHQMIRDLDGKLLADKTVQHVYLIRDGLIHSMEIRETDSTPEKLDSSRTS
jgi:SnoaL-like protein